MNNQKSQKYNSPYLLFDPKNKVFTLKLKDNEFLHYVNKDDALFIELYIYSMVSVPDDGIKGATSDNLSKMIVNVGERIVLRYLIKGIEFRNEIEAFIASEFESLGIEMDKNTLADLMFQLKGLSFIISDGLKSLPYHRIDFVKEKLKKYNATMIFT